jgi:hypothetical protein
VQRPERLAALDRLVGDIGCRERRLGEHHGDGIDRG